MVRTSILPPVVGVLPMVNPVIVMVTELLFPIVPVPFDRTIDVCPGSAAVHDALDEVTFGVDIVAKKSEG